MNGKNKKQGMRVPEQHKIIKKHLTYLFGAVLLAGLYMLSMGNYLLYHAIAEVFSIIVAFGIFIVAWNCRKNLDSDYLLLLGIAYFFVGCIDFLHTLAYKGMGVFSPAWGSNLPTQLWVTARYVESISLLAAPLFIRRKLRLPRAFMIYTAVLCLVLLTIFYWHIFPVAYVEGHGLTPFKKISEMAIGFIFFLSVFRLLRRRERFDRNVLWLLASSIIVSIGSETAFIFYVDVFGISNFIGHILKIVSFYMIYKAIIETGLRQPFDLLYRDLKKSESRLRELNATKDKFFSIIAHDLRTPLISATTAFRYILDDYESLSADEIKRLVRNLDKSTDRTLTLLNNLLDWEKCQSGEMQCRPERYRLNDLLNEAMAPMESAAENKNIELVVRAEKDPWVRADRNMINTAMRNLISNAVKFSEPGSRVIVAITAAGHRAELSVRDNGTGMTPEDVEKLFKIEEQFIKPGTRREKGSGLGLILSRSFIRMNGGDLRVESAPGRGSTFSFTLPLA